MSDWAMIEAVFCKLCGKRQFADPQDAGYYARRFPQTQVPYRCPYGQGWHLTRNTNPW